LQFAKTAPASVGKVEYVLDNLYLYQLVGLYQSILFAVYWEEITLVIVWKTFEIKIDFRTIAESEKVELERIEFELELEIRVEAGRIESEIKIALGFETVKFKITDVITDSIDEDSEIEFVTTAISISTLLVAAAIPDNPSGW